MKVRSSILIRSAGKILLMSYDYEGREVLGVPGGGVSDGETLADAAIRELEEELSIITAIDGLLLVGEALPVGKLPHTLHVIFSGGIISGDPRPNPAETKAICVVWLDENKLDKVLLYPNAGAALLPVLKGERAPGYAGVFPEREWV